MCGFYHTLNITRKQKRKSDALSAEDDVEDDENTEGRKYQKTKSGGSSKEGYVNDDQQQAITSNYEERMEVIKKFIQDRAEKDKAMSWELCLLEARQKCNWKTCIRDGYNLSKGYTT
ncbi:hypothetical protein BDF21DRAFT_448197 [Thamnidium elegans]|nr:hypothetical protein BDF21DRAFT_448197 [Thamnidium elegans]